MSTTGRSSSPRTGAANPPADHASGAARRFLIGGLGIVVTALVGIAAGSQPIPLIAGLIGIGLLAIALLNITMGLMVFAVAVCLESLPDLSIGASVAQLCALALGAGWVLGRATRRAEWSGRGLLISNAPLAWILALMLAWIGFSLLWAEDKHETQLAIVYFCFDILLFPVALVALRRTSDVATLFVCLVGGALLAALIASATAPAGDVRLEGGGFNPNQLAIYLLAGTVLAATVASDRAVRGGIRLAMAGAALVCPIVLVMTGSRGATVALAAAVLVMPLAAGRGRRLKALVLIASISLLSVLWVAAFAPAPLVQRLTTWEADQGSGRIDLWTIAWRITQDRPLTGVGADNFKVASVHYLIRPGATVRADYIVDKPQEPHSVYLGFLAELGVVGLALFLTLLAYCLYCILRAIRLFTQQRNTTGEVLSRGLLVTIVSLMCAIVFTSSSYDKHFYLLLAVAPALLAIARSNADPLDSVHPSRERSTPALRDRVSPLARNPGTWIRG